MKSNYSMLCPICIEQNQKTRDSIDAKDMTGHLMSMHDKPEIARSYAKTLWSNKEEVVA